MRIELLLLAIGFASAEVFKQFLKRQPSSRWTEPQLLEQFQQSRPEGKNRACSRYSAHSCSKKTTIAPQKLFSFYDSIYTGVITMGTPPQNFTVAIDTGSVLLWIESAVDCSTRECIGEADGHTRNRFNATASSTFNVTSTPFQVSYLKGGVGGFYAKDDFSLGGLNVTGQEFGIAYRVSDDFRTAPWDGILGLAWPAEDGVVPPFQNLINQLDEPIFTIFLDRQATPEAGSVGGQVTYGGHDLDHCEKETNYVPVNGKSHWQFAIDGFAVGNFSSSSKAIAVSDTGCTMIGAPPDAFDAIVAETNATLLESKNLYILPCDGEYPDMRFNIGGKEFIIEPREYLLHIATTNFFTHFVLKNTCILAVMKIEELEVGVTWLLGEPFVRQYCIVHDVGRARIGLAKAIHPVPA